MSALFDHICALIEKQGPLSVASYMELALQHPEYGYYQQHDPLGRSGDFITAPEISQMFGEMIGLWCVDVWHQMGKPNKFTLLELGPGRGTLIQDALRATVKIPGFHGAMELLFLESNKTLRKTQQEKLVAYKFNYLDDLTELPPQPTLIITNEFFDALPLRQFERNFQGWCERLITLENNRLVYTSSPLNEMMAQLIPENMREANPGTVYEVSLPTLSIARALSKHIVKNSGAMLIVDYGFVEPCGQSTLQAVSNHQHTSVLTRPGEVDLTAHLDFSALRSLASGQNANVSGPIGQGDFLKTLGIELRAVQLKQRTTPKQAADIDSALQRLVDPAQMGALFKVMAISSPQLQDLAGF